MQCDQFIKTFNISTLSCFVVAGTGQKVAKHGNYGATSISGASNVMELLGYQLKNHPDKLKREIEESNFCFLHAPLFHPALKAVGPIRKNLGIRTFFNMLGPMVNPAAPAFQLVGVYNLEMARIYNYLLQQTGRSFTIIHGLDGYFSSFLLYGLRRAGGYPFLFFFQCPGHQFIRLFYYFFFIGQLRTVCL